MRLEIFPFLEKCFGKKVIHNLRQLGGFFSLAKEYFKENLGPFTKGVKKASYGILWELPDKSWHLIELLFLMKQFAAEQNLFLSREMLEGAAKALMEKKGGPKQFISKGMLLVIEKQKVMVFRNGYPQFFSSQELPLVPFQEGDWQYCIEDVKAGKAGITWGEMWEEGFFTQVPSSGPLWLEPYENVKNNAALQESLKKKKVPSFLRSFFPYVVDAEGGAYHFWEGLSAISFKNKTVKLTVCQSNYSEIKN
jgi:hypothetical protein